MNVILPDFPMPIITPRLILRPPKLGEGKIVNEAVIESFELLQKFMPWAKEKPSIEDTEIFVRQAVENWVLKNNDEPYLPLFIFNKLTNQFIGTTGYHHYDWRAQSIETGYWIRQSCTGKGLMTEAVNAVTQYAFKQLGIKRITITCNINNLKSKKIPEWLGFILEKTLKSNRRDLLTNELSDTLVYLRYNIDKLPDLLVRW